MFLHCDFLTYLSKAHSFTKLHNGSPLEKEILISKISMEYVQSNFT